MRSKSTYSTFGAPQAACSYYLTRKTSQLMPHHGRKAMTKAERSTTNLRRGRSKTSQRGDINRANEKTRGTRRTGGTRTPHCGVHSQNWSGRTVESAQQTNQSAKWSHCICRQVGQVVVISDYRAHSSVRRRLSNGRSRGKRRQRTNDCVGIHLAVRPVPKSVSSPQPMKI